MLNVASEPYIFLYYITYGVTYTVTPQLMISKICHGMYNNHICSKISTGSYKTEETIIYEKTAFWNTINFSAVCIPSAFVILFFGALSDIVGKKKLISIVPIVTALQSVVYMLSAYYVSTSLWLLVFGTTLTSIFAGVSGATLLGVSYLADVTAADENRTVRMNIFAAMIYISLGASSYGSGILLKRYGFLAAYSLSIAASVANVIFVAFLLPDEDDKEPKEDRKDSTSKPTSLYSNIFLVFHCLKMALQRLYEFSKAYIFSWEKMPVWLLLIATFFTNSATLGEEMIIVIFLKHTPLSLSPDQIGIFIFIIDCVRGFAVILVAFISMKLFKPSDQFLITIGQISIIIFLVGAGLSSKLQTLFVVTPLIFCFPLAIPGLCSAMTKCVLPEEYGTVLSFVYFSGLIGMSIVTLAANKVFQATAAYFPGTCIILLAGSCLVGFVFTLLAFNCKSNTSEKSSEPNGFKKGEIVPLLETGAVD